MRKGDNVHKAIIYTLLTVYESIIDLNMKVQCALYILIFN